MNLSARGNISANESDDTIDIGELSRATGVAVSALRFYDETGLVPATGRRSRQRTYPDHTVDRVALIVAAQRCGFTLAEIRALLDDHQQDRTLWRTALRNKAAQLRREAHRHETMASMLEHTIACRAADPLTCTTLLTSIHQLADM